MKYIYMLSLGSNPKLFATNFKILYDTLKANKKQLEIIHIMNYQLLVKRARKGKELEFTAVSSKVYIIKRIPLLSNIASLEKIDHNLF